MKQKKLISITGAMALLLGVGMSLQHALDDYGIADNPLSEFMLVQAQTSHQKKKGDQRTADFECTGNSGSSSSSSSSQTNTSGNTNTGTGSGSAGIPVINGKYEQSNSNNSSNSGTNAGSSSGNAGASWKGTVTMYYCGIDETKECVSYNPCRDL